MVNSPPRQCNPSMETLTMAKTITRLTSTGTVTNTTELMYVFSTPKEKLNHGLRADGTLITEWDSTPTLLSLKDKFATQLKL